MENSSSCQNIDNDDLFQSLINYQDNYYDVSMSVTDKSAGLTPRLQPMPKITFLEPNIDVLHNFSANINKKALLKLNQDKIEDIRIQQLPFDMASGLDKKSFRLEIIEQPQQCRTSGFAGKDRRPIDPAPIVKLTILDENQSVENNPDSIFYILHASIWSVDMTHQYDVVEGNDSAVTLLLGSLVSSTVVLKDINNKPGIYFSFPDLSIRTGNEYRLKFSLLDLRRDEVLTTVFSDPFTVYSAKSYPGMKESSSISRHLAKQGLKVTIRNGHQLNK